MKIGEIRYNKLGTPMRIVDIRSSDDITIEFLDLHNMKKKTTYSNFKNGGIKNPYDRSIKGVGYLGEGKYMTGQSFYDRKAFGIWTGMIDRVYNEEKRSKYETYSDCIICDEWQNYQSFRGWYDKEFYQVGTERMHIDKDILYKNNRVYSPQTCLIVPQRINMLFMHKSNKYGLPNGITPMANGRYSASYNGKQIGKYNSLEEATVAHDKEKKKAVNEVAEEYKEVIPDKVYQALINWIPDYIDYSECS